MTGKEQTTPPTPSKKEEPTPPRRKKVSNEAALRYIRSAIVNGQSRDHIRARLKENGFTDEEIDDLFEGYDRDHKPTDSMDDGPP